MEWPKKLLAEAGIANERDAKRHGIPPPTYYRIKKGSINRHLLHTLNLRAGQVKKWRGIKIRDGYLILPDNTVIHANEILSIPYGKELAYQQGYEKGRANSQLSIWGHHNPPAHTISDGPG